MRDALLRHVPDPTSEFSLSGELSFLFRMMATPGTLICQVWCTRCERCGCVGVVDERGGVGVGWGGFGGM